MRPTNDDRTEKLFRFHTESTFIRKWTQINCSLSKHNAKFCDAVANALYDAVPCAVFTASANDKSSSQLERNKKLVKLSFINTKRKRTSAGESETEANDGARGESDRQQLFSVAVDPISFLFHFILTSTSFLFHKIRKYFWIRRIQARNHHRKRERKMREKKFTARNSISTPHDCSCDCRCRYRHWRAVSQNISLSWYNKICSEKCVFHTQKKMRNECWRKRKKCSLHKSSKCE